MTKFMVNNRTDALKTDINLFFYDNKLSNCPLSLADASHEFQIHVSVRMLTIKFNQRARVNFCSYRKKFFDRKLLQIFGGLGTNPATCFPCPEPAQETSDNVSDYNLQQLKSNQKAIPNFQGTAYTA